MNISRFLLPLVAACALSTSADAAIITLNLLGTDGVGLLPQNENPDATVGGPGTGGEIGSGITFDTTSKVLSIEVGWGSTNGFVNLTGVVTGAHIHGATTIGSEFTTNAGVVVNFATNGVTAGYTSASFVLNTSASAGSVVGTVVLDAARESELLANRLYINVHTSLNPGGEARGNIVVPEPGTAGLLGLSLAGLLLRRRRR